MEQGCWTLETFQKKLHFRKSLSAWGCFQVIWAFVTSLSTAGNVPGLTSWRQKENPWLTLQKQLPVQLSVTSINEQFCRIWAAAIWQHSHLRTFCSPTRSIWMTSALPVLRACCLVCVLHKQLQEAKCRVGACGETNSLWAGLRARTSVSSEG